MKQVIIIYILILNYCFSQDKGKKAFDNKDYNASFEYYKTILDKRRDDNSAKYSAGVAAYKKNDPESAKYYLNEAKNSNDKILSSKAFYNLAEIYRDENKIEESLDYLKKAIKLNPDDRDAKINFELLKQLNNQNDSGSEQEQNQESGQDSEPDQKQSQDNQNNSDSKQEQNQERGQDSEPDQKQSQDNQNNLDSEQEQGQEMIKNKDFGNTQSEKNNMARTDKEIQAEAILNALRGQEKINQKQKILKSKTRNLEKDW